MVYRVVRTIRGRKYIYEQESYRDPYDPRKVRTKSKYIGPVSPRARSSDGSGTPALLGKAYEGDFFDPDATAIVAELDALEEKIHQEEKRQAAIKYLRDYHMAPEHDYRSDAYDENQALSRVSERYRESIWRTAEKPQPNIPEEKPMQTDGKTAWLNQSSPPSEPPSSSSSPSTTSSAPASESSLPSSSSSDQPSTTPGDTTHGDN